MASDSGTDLRKIYLLQDQAAAPGNDAGPSAENEEQQSGPCVSHGNTVRRGDEEPACDQPSDSADNVAAEEGVNVIITTEPKDDVAQGECVSVEAEQPLQPRERKLKPTFKKPTKKAIQQEEKMAEKQAAEEPAPGGHIDSKC